MITAKKSAFIKGVLIGAIMLLVSCLDVSAMEIAGVDVPKSETIGNRVLVLNGAGIRKKFFVKVYVGSLYLPVKRSTVDKILAEPDAKRIVMTFLREVGEHKLVNAWNEGFTSNTTPTELLALKKRIDAFSSLFTTVKKGDVIRIDYLPERGTQVWINGAMKGTVSGEDFHRALLKIWLGNRPADAGLKKAWLGK
jgi:hypothetical protein